MKILIQDRSVITTEGKELWITTWGSMTDYMVMHNGYINSQLGLYHSKERALEVLAELYSGIESGKSTFIMPVK